MPAAEIHEPGGRYAAFISYAHVDRRWADWLHRRLETYRLPKAVAPDEARRLGKVFIDRSELASAADLTASIKAALDGSDALIVICSPRAAASRWVNEEIRQFRAAGRGDRVFCLIVAGDPAGVTDPSPFPPALTEGSAAAEPLAADVRPGKDGRQDAVLKLIAGLRRLPLDALRRREQMRRQRRLAAVALVSTVLLLIMTGLAVGQVIARREADRARAEAERQRDTALRTSTFFTDMFDEANPDYANGRDPTVRSMLEHNAQDTLRSPVLAHEPETRANLLTSLAGVFARLGQIDRSDALLRAATSPPSSDPDILLSQAALGAEIALQRGEYQRARALAEQGLALPVVTERSRRAMRSVLLGLAGQASSLLHEVERAQGELAAARYWALHASPPDPKVATSQLMVAALAEVEAGHLERADTMLHQVVRERQALGQPNHPNILTAQNSLGAIAAKRGQIVAAERAFRETLKLQTALLGPDHPDVARTRNNLGRVLVEQRRFAEARPALLTARDRLVAVAGPRLDALANVDDSLGLADTGLGGSASARAAFVRGLSIAREHAMPKEIELLADRAALECGVGEVAVGRKLVGEARGALARFALPEPWRAARLDQVEAGCLLASGQRRAAAPLVRRSADVVVARWGTRSLFGAEAARQRRAIAGVP